MAKRKDIIASGIRTYSPYFTLRHNQRVGKEGKISTIVSSKIQKNAVDRNKTKRLVREIIKRHKKDIKDSTQVVIFIKKETLKLSKKDFDKELVSIFKKAKIIK